ncbi:MAG: isochorismate synthase [Myxococcales bacterium]|nr:isochorismate synthase [Myxococcales bacterium]
MAVDDVGPWVRWVEADGQRLETRGVKWSVTAPSLGALSARLRPRLASLGAGERVWYAASFDPSVGHQDDPVWAGFAPCMAFLPEACVETRGGQGAVSGGVRREAVGDPEGWRRLVGEALEAFASQGLEKVVGARRAVVPWRGERRALCEALDGVAAASGGVSFAVAPPERQACFVGATPERLLRRAGRRVSADALAGSLPRVPGRDAAVAEALLRSEKDLREHRYVRDALIEKLGAFCDEIAAPPEPVVKILPNVVHLYTPVEGRLRDPSVDALTLVEALHPTPAVGGTPQEAARAWIAAHEPVPRGWYAGPVGWCDGAGDGSFVVALRSAVLREGAAWVFAGAGLVAGSDPAHEWRETEAKMQAMLGALGAAEGRVSDGQ